MKCQECGKTGKRTRDAGGAVHVLCRRCLLTILGHYADPNHTCHVCKRQEGAEVSDVFRPCCKCGEFMDTHPNIFESGHLPVQEEPEVPTDPDDITPEEAAEMLDDADTSRPFDGQARTLAGHVRRLLAALRRRDTEIAKQRMLVAAALRGGEVIAEERDAANAKLARAVVLLRERLAAADKAIEWAETANAPDVAASMRVDVTLCREFLRDIDGGNQNGKA